MITKNMQAYQKDKTTCLQRMIENEIFNIVTFSKGMKEQAKTYLRSVYYSGVVGWFIENYDVLSLLIPSS